GSGPPAGRPPWPPPPPRSLAGPGSSGSAGGATSREAPVPAFVVEILEPVEAVPAVAHDFAGLADIAELLGQFEQAGLGANDFLVLGHDSVSWSRRDGGCATPTSSAPATAQSPCSERHRP